MGRYCRAMRRIALLGSTGSIGTQTLDVCQRLGDQVRVVALSANTDGNKLREQAVKFGVKNLALMDETAAREHEIPGGMQAMIDLVTADEIDTVLVAVAGVIGLLPTMAAIQAGKTIALASKEVLVSAGEIVMPACAASGSAMVPIDSEHSAIFQCVQGMEPGHIAELLITGSGGPFRGRSKSELQSVTKDQALKHPTWIMGGKITIDSATLMNKGLEVIEARWLFGVDLDNVSVVIHPQSIIHSFVRTVDGSVLAQIGLPDMRLPIQYALTYPDRIDTGLPAWKPEPGVDLTFEEPDHESFPCIGLAREAARIGKTMPCVMNAANEEVVNAFLRGECGFLDIPRVIEQTMQRHTAADVDLDTLVEVDGEARLMAAELIGTT